MPQHDHIHRVVLLPAPPDEVWDALTQPEHLAGWFGRCDELDLRPGGAATFVDDDGQTLRARVEIVEPQRRFAFRWRFPEHASPTDAVRHEDGTLVEFTLEPAPDGTLLTLVESGFEHVLRPQSVPVAALTWHRNIDGLVAYLGASVGA